MLTVGEIMLTVGEIMLTVGEIMLTVGEIMLTVGEMVRALRVMLPSSILPCGSPARLRMPLGMVTVGEMVRALRWEAGCRAIWSVAVGSSRFLRLHRLTRRLT